MVSENRSKLLTKDSNTMALDQSALLDLLAQLNLTDVPDRIQSATETLYQQLIEAEATAFISAPFRTLRCPHRPAQRFPAEDVDHHGRGSAPVDPEAAAGEVLPRPSGAPPPGRPGLVRGRDGGLRPRRLDPQGRRPRQSPRRRHWHLQVGPRNFGSQQEALGGSHRTPGHSHKGPVRACSPP